MKTFALWALVLGFASTANALSTLTDKQLSSCLQNIQVNPNACIVKLNPEDADQKELSALIQKYVSRGSNMFTTHYSDQPMLVDSAILLTSNNPYEFTLVVDANYRTNPSAKQRDNNFRDTLDAFVKVLREQN